MALSLGMTFRRIFEVKQRRHTATYGATRSHDVFQACLVVCGLLMACDKTPKVVRDLPELPAEFARDLAPARTAPVLMTKPTITPPVALPPARPPLPLEIARACTSVWEGFVTYPVTVCYPPSNQVEGLDLTPSPGAPSRHADNTKVPLVRYYKLTSHPRAKFALPAFCSVRSGPWLGRVEGKQFCGANPNIRVFTAEILGTPEPIVVQWTGTLADVPPPLHLVGEGSESESCICCSGVTCPNGSCKPNFNLCGTMPPALK